MSAGRGGGRAGLAALALAMVVSAVSSACTSDDDGAGQTTTTTAATAAEGEPGGEPERSSHVLMVFYDGLDQGVVDSPDADLLALLAEVGAVGTVPAGTAGDDGCIQPWVDALRADGAVDGAHVFDEIAAAVDGADLGLFTTSPATAEALAPAGDAVVQVGAPEVPGLDPWPSARLAIDATRMSAIRHVSETDGASVTVAHLDVFEKAAADPDAATLGPIATKTADDFLDLAISAADARPSRPGEDWLFLAVGGCAADGTLPFIVEGDRVDQPQDLGEMADGHAMAGALAASYLGAPFDGWPDLPIGFLVEGEGE